MHHHYYKPVLLFTFATITDTQEMQTLNNHTKWNTVIKHMTATNQVTSCIISESYLQNTDHLPLFISGTTSKSTFQLFIFMCQHFAMLHLLFQLPLHLAFESRQSGTLFLRLVQLSLQLLHFWRHLVGLFNNGISSTDIWPTVFDRSYSTTASF